MSSTTVIIPTLEEAAWVGGCIRSVRGAFAELPVSVDIIVVDGGSSDETRDVARDEGADRVISAARGRARQINEAARQARGEWLVFLHADARLTVDWAEQFDAAIHSDCGRAHRPALIGGWSCVELFSATRRAMHQRLALELVERGINWRTRTFKTMTAEQAIFVRRDVFDDLDGVPEVPLLEGNRFARKLRGRGAVRILSGPVRISDRRWIANGVVRTSLMMYAIRLADRLGVPPRWLAWLWERSSI